MDGPLHPGPDRKPLHQPVRVGLDVDTPDLARDITRVLAYNGGYLVQPLATNGELSDPQGGGRDGYDVGVPELVVLARQGPQAEACDAVRRLRSRFPTSRLVLILRRSRGTVELRKAVALGADAVVFHDELETTLDASVAAVHCGQLALPRALHDHLARQPLTAREKQVIGLAVHGLANKEIAGRLFLAESTVKCHLSSVFEKLNVRSRAEAATLILDPNEGLAPSILAVANGHVLQQD